MRNHLIISIPANRVDEANAFCKTMIIEGGEKTFEIPLSTRRDEKPEKYWCCWNLSPDEENQLRTGLPYAEFRKFYDRTGNKSDRITAEEYLQEKVLVRADESFKETVRIIR